MVSAQEVQTKIREATPTQWSVVAASALTLLAFFFSIGGLAGVWWAGSFEMSNRHIQIQVDFASTLWETTVKTSVDEESTEETRSIDDICAEDNLSDEVESRCGKVRTVRAFVFLEFIACLASVACAVVWLCLEVLQSSGGAILMRKGLLISAVSCNAFACFSALLAVIVASTLDYSEVSEDVGVNGGGFVLTILSLVLCLAPGNVLGVLALRWTYWPPAATVRPVDLPKVADLPNLVRTKAQSGNESSKTEHGAVEIEAAVAGREQSGADLEAAKTECA